MFGTLITDNLTDRYNVPLTHEHARSSPRSSRLVFAVWYAVERTLSIHTIVTTRREAFYWLAILFTFALGTAAGDLVAEKLGLGYARLDRDLRRRRSRSIAVAHYGFRRRTRSSRSGSPTS